MTASLTLFLCLLISSLPSLFLSHFSFLLSSNSHPSVPLFSFSPSSHLSSPLFPYFIFQPALCFLYPLPFLTPTPLFHLTFSLSPPFPSFSPFLTSKSFTTSQEPHLCDYIKGEYDICISEEGKEERGRRGGRGKEEGRGSESPRRCHKLSVEN